MCGTTYRNPLASAECPRYPDLEVSPRQLGGQPVRCSAGSGFAGVRRKILFGESMTSVPSPAQAATGQRARLAEATGGVGADADALVLQSSHTVFQLASVLASSSAIQRSSPWAQTP